MYTRLLALLCVIFSSATIAERVNYCIDTINSDCLLENVYEALTELERHPSYPSLVGETAALAASTKNQLPLTIIGRLPLESFKYTEMFRKAEIAAYLGATGKIDKHNYIANQVKTHLPAYNYYLLSTIKYLDSANHTALTIYRTIRSGSPHHIQSESAIYLAALLQDNQADIATQLYEDLNGQPTSSSNKLIYLSDLIATLLTHDNEDIAKVLYARLQKSYSHDLIWPEVDAFLGPLTGAPVTYPPSSNPYIHSYALYHSASKNLNEGNPADASQHLTLMVSAIETIDDPSQRLYFYHRALKSFF